MKIDFPFALGLIVYYMNVIFTGKIISTVFTYLLLLFFMYFILYAAVHRFSRKEHRASLHRLTAIVSLSAMLLVLSDIAYYGSVTETLVYELAVAMFPMIAGMKADVTWEDTMPYGLGVLCFSALVAMLRLLAPQKAQWLAPLFEVLPIFIVLALGAVMHVDFLKMISDKGHVLRASSVRTRVGSDLDTLYIFCLLAIFIAQLSTTEEYPVFRSVVFIICFFSMLILFLCCHLRITSGNLLVLHPKRDRELKEMMDMCVNDTKGSMRIEHNYRAIYERVLLYFENEKPYLDPDLDLDNVAKNTYSSRLYVSRAITLCSGRNFRQYVNYYRIKHAVRVFEDDRDMKLQQWAELAGFKTVACFNMAFRLYMNESPGDWSRRLKGTVPRLRGKKMLAESL